MSAIPPARGGAGDDEIEVRFTVRQMIIATAVIGVILALLVQIPILVVVVLDAILLGFGLYKVAKAPAHLRPILVIAIAFVGLGCCMAFWLVVPRF
jgi:hypothetical protein